MRAKRNYFVDPSDPILLAKAEEIPLDQIKSKEVQDTIETMLNIAYGEQEDRAKPILVGLAAPQVGVSKQIILVDVGSDGRGGVSDLRVYINPKITNRAKEKEEWYECCFSTDAVCGIITRPLAVTIEAFNREGKPITEEYRGYVARIFQHEIDHLNGREFTYYVKDDNNLHWVEDYEFPIYRDKEGWRNWSKKCSREKWEKIKGIK